MNRGWAMVERGLELSRRAFETVSFENLSFLLTNDTRSLSEFDRCSLVTHLDGTSRLEAVNGQPILDKKSLLYAEITGLAKHLRGFDRAAVLPRKHATEQEVDPNVPADLLGAVRFYFDHSDSDYLAILPLTDGDVIAGHLLLEFFGQSPPDRAGLEVLARIAPFLGATLTQKWLFKRKPNLKSLLYAGSSGQTKAFSRKARHLMISGAIGLMLALVLFALPITDTVGGESEIIPRNKHVAFCRMEGVIDEVFAKEGDSVEKGQVLARLDPRDIDYRIKKAETDFQITTEKLALLRSSSGEDESRLAESRLVEIERKGSWLDLNYYKWLKQFLDIKAPVTGIIITKDIETLKGKKLQTGDPFCELVCPDELWAEIYVPDDRVAEVRAGQPVTLYLNQDPLKGYELTVKEVAPEAKPHQRLGNVFEVRAPFPEGSKFAKVGMKGIGKIETTQTNLWSLITRRLLKAWNKISLYF